VELLWVRYVNVSVPTDASAAVGLWPDPLPAFAGPIELEADKNQPVWVRVKVPRAVPAGVYKGNIYLEAKDYKARVPIWVEVYDFVLPERMTCTTAFGFSAENVWRYHNVKSEQQRREVLDKYLASFSAHHISPYDPAPLDAIGAAWPDVKAPASKLDVWENLRIVDNEVHSGQGGLLIYDDDPKKNVGVSYKPLIAIPQAGFRFSCWYRTAIPGHRFTVSLSHYDEQGKWMEGQDRDHVLTGDGRWQRVEEQVGDFPSGAKFVRMNVFGARWTAEGQETGLVWYDDISVTNVETGQELVEGGDFEPVHRTEPLWPVEKLQPRLDFSAWDRAMSLALDEYHFNSFRLEIPGIGGGTYYEIIEPSLLGFGEKDPEYGIMFDSYCRQLQGHLAERGWLEQAFIYWFDEPSAEQYGFVMRGFEKLKRSCPRINRMLTEQPEPELFGGPNIYCVISTQYDHKAAEQRRKQGDKFWWYICTAPKAPYCTLFIDHPGTELRVWLWQTWQRNIEGILVWNTNYWTSSTAYPERGRPQNPYEDPMGWVSGYGTPAGQKLPWGNGDGRFIYPPESAADGRAAGAVLDGPVDSIRWEMLRDGIEDYEYLAMLKKLVEAHRDKLTGEEISQYTGLLEVPESITADMVTFTTDPAAIEARRDAVGCAIEKLSRL
jgi:hypothetical protein